MSGRLKNFMRNFSYTLTSNFISLMISTIVILIIPKLIGIEEYGYWQLYLFYSTYIGFFHFGWNDGIYLRYGGEKYGNLNKQVFYSQFYMLVTLQILIALIIYLVSIYLLENPTRLLIWRMLAINLFLFNIRSMLLFILQGTNRIKEFSQIVIIEKVMYIFLIIVFLVVGINDIRLLIIADLIGKFVSLLYAMYCCKDIVFHEISKFSIDLKETIKNINVGIKLMFANFSSILIIGIVRFGIERNWSVEEFGKISLILSISNFMMVFINAIGIILFPILRRLKKETLPDIYITIRDFLMVILFSLLIVYFPLKSMLLKWLPSYADSLLYLAILFPIFIYEGKTVLLVNTYFKTLRKEKLMLGINLITLCISILLTLISTLIFKNLEVTILTIIFLLGFKSIIGELLLASILSISVLKDIILEFFMTIIFIFLGWLVDDWYVIFVYLFFYFFYLIIKKKDITQSIYRLRTMIK